MIANEARPFEEYKEMIKDMSKEQLIRGLYDLSKELIKKDYAIQKLKEAVYDESNKYYDDDGNFSIVDGDYIKTILDEIKY